MTWTNTSRIRRHVLEYNEEVCVCITEGGGGKGGGRKSV